MPNLGHLAFEVVSPKIRHMTYPFVPIGLIAVFVICLVYFLFIKRDMKKVKMILYPGLFFTAVWAAIYFLWLK